MTDTTVSSGQEEGGVGIPQGAGCPGEAEEESPAVGTLFPKVSPLYHFCSKDHRTARRLGPTPERSLSKDRGRHVPGSFKKMCDYTPQTCSQGRERPEQKQSTSMCVYIHSSKRHNPRHTYSSDTPRHVQVRDKQNQLPKTHIQDTS